MAALYYYKWAEGRTSFFGITSAAHKRMLERKARREAAAADDSVSTPSCSDDMNKTDSNKDDLLQSPTEETPEVHLAPSLAHTGRAMSEEEPLKN